jgi:hypothetical protein
VLFRSGGVMGILGPCERSRKALSVFTPSTIATFLFRPKLSGACLEIYRISGKKQLLTGALLRTPRGSARPLRASSCSPRGSAPHPAWRPEAPRTPHKKGKGVIPLALLNGGSGGPLVPQQGSGGGAPGGVRGGAPPGPGRVVQEKTRGFAGSGEWG